MIDRFDVRDLPGPDLLSRQAVVDRAARLLRPRGALARLDEIAAWLAEWQRTDCPAVNRPVLLLAAGDHGVTRRGVSSLGPDLTRATVDAIRAGVATSTVMARTIDVAVRLVDAGVGEPTGDLTVEAALDDERFEELLAIGRETVEELSADLLLLGDLGVGSTTAAAAVAATFCGGPVENWVGRSPGIDDDAYERKVEAVRSARLRVGAPAPEEVLRQLGGNEMAVLAGACLEARRRSIPVLIDGFVTAASVAPLGFAEDGALAHCMASHVSPEPGHGRLLDRLGLRPLLDLQMQLGEGTGALAALPIVRMAAAGVVDVATTEEWGLR